MSKPGPKIGSSKSAAHKAKLSKAGIGKKNSQYKDGRRSYRTKAGAKPGDVVMHVNGKSPKEPGANVKSNLKISKGKKVGAKTTSEHEKSKVTIKERKAGRKRKK